MQGKCYTIFNKQNLNQSKDDISICLYYMGFLSFEFCGELQKYLK